MSNSSKLKYVEVRMNTGNTIKLVSGYVPKGLEYFNGYYNERPIEYSLYFSDNVSDDSIIDIVYLDSGTVGPLEMDHVQYKDLQY